MVKLPTKEEILARQGNQDGKSSQSAGEGSDVAKAKENAEIAKQTDIQTEHEINIKLREQGYASLQEGLADVEKKLKEADDILLNIRQQEQSIAEEAQEVAQNKEKVLNAGLIVKRREETVSARLEEAIQLEKARQSELEGYKSLRDELIQLIEYHKTQIVPIRGVLDTVNRTVNKWMSILDENTKYDFTILTNFIHSKMRLLDKYIETTPQTVGFPKVIKKEEIQTADDVNSISKSA